MDAPCGSVTIPVSVAVCVCAATGGARENTIRETTEKRKDKTRTEVCMRSPPLPFRAGGKGCPRVRDRFRLSRLRTPSVSWLGGTAPRGLPAPAFRTVARAELLRLTVARRRRACTVFPARSLRWMWRSVAASYDAAMLRVNDLAAPHVRPRNKSNRNSRLRSKLQLHVASSLRRARKFTRGRPAGPNSTSSGASKTCSSNSRW